MKTLALRAIRLYQRYLSPRKGFACAYRACTGGASCSELAYRAIRRYGLPGGLRVLDARLQRCRLASARRRSGWPRTQAGDCDCDLPCSPFDACDSASCDWSRSERKPDKRKDRKPPPCQIPNRASGAPPMAFGAAERL